MNHNVRLSLISAGIFGLSACLGGGGSSDSTTGGGGSTIDTSSAFPAGLAVSSPTARTNASLRVSASTAVADSEYDQATTKIADLLSSTSDPKDVFKAQLLLQTSGNANCYGPSMAYTNHPGGGDGNFPGGDLGIWTESESNGEACASAELNQRLSGISSRTIMGLMGLAGVISVVKSVGLTLPTAGNTLTLTTNMNNALIPDVTFSSATLSLSADSTTWNYNLAFVYDDSGTSRNIVLALTHKPGASVSQYEGLFSYRVDVPSMGGNCTGAPAGATMNGTLYYNRASDSSLLVNSREGSYCGTDVTAATASDVGVTGGTSFQLLDPSATYNSRPGDPVTTNANGWGDNFNMFAGNFNPNTLAGDYVYAWQAGSNDSNSRTFQLHMNAGAADGEAYFGFGDWVGTTDGSIDGMICNWAGPGNSHTPVSYVQRQAITFNTVSKQFEASSSDITYAPTTTCLYDGSGIFDYDRNQLDGLTGTDTVIVRTSGAGAGELNLDLMSQDTATTMQEAIDNRGFVLPAL